MKQLNWKVARVGFPGKNAINPEVLSSHVGAEVFPFRVFRIVRGLNWIGAHMTEGARHTNAIGTNELLVVVITGIIVVAFGVPAFRSRFIEVWIWKQAKTNNTRRITIVGSDRNVLATRANLYARIFGFVFKWVRTAGGIADVEPQTIAIRFRAGCLLEARLVH